MKTDQRREAIRALDEAVAALDRQALDEALAAIERIRGIILDEDTLPAGNGDIEKVGREEAAATPRQTWALRCLTGKDWRPYNLTLEQASNIIERCIDIKKQRKDATTKAAKDALVMPSPESLNLEDFSDANFSGRVKKVLANMGGPKFAAPYQGPPNE